MKNDNEFVSTSYQFENAWTLSGHEATVLSIAFSPDSKRVVTAASRHAIRVYDVNTGKETVIVEVTPPPHLGWHKFVARFGMDAMRFVNSPVGRELHLRRH